jgi:hypothetical protein
MTALQYATRECALLSDTRKTFSGGLETKRNGVWVPYP